MYNVIVRSELCIDKSDIACKLVAIIIWPHDRALELYAWLLWIVWPKIWSVSIPSEIGNVVMVSISSVSARTIAETGQMETW